MKTLLGFLAIVCFGLLAQAAKAADVERTVEASPSGTVSIENTAGTAVISGWSRSQVEVTGELGRDVEALDVRRDGNTVNVHVRSGRGGRAVSADLTIRVPERSSIEVSGVSLDIDVSGVQGSQRLQSVSGDVKSEAFGADLDVETVSGDIEIKGNGDEGRAHLNTVSGDAELHNLAGEIEMTSVSGDLEVVGGRWSRVKANTTSGDFDFEGELPGSGRMDIETINGDLGLMFKGGLSATIDVETFNGDVDNCFGPDPVRTSRYAPGTELKFTQGDGDGRLTIRTLNGDLTLCKD